MVRLCTLYYLARYTLETWNRNGNHIYARLCMPLSWYKAPIFSEQAGYVVHTHTSLNYVNIIINLHEQQYRCRTWQQWYSIRASDPYRDKVYVGTCHGVTLFKLVNILYFQSVLDVTAHAADDRRCLSEASSVISCMSCKSRKTHRGIVCHHL